MSRCRTPGLHGRWLLTAAVIVLTVLLTSATAHAQEGALCNAEPTDMPVNYGDAVRCSIGIAGDSDVFRFSGAAGETIVIQASTGGSALWPCIDLIAPDNSRLRACTIATFNRLDATLTVTGTYTIVVTSYFATIVGNYALALERLAPPSTSARPIQYGQTVLEQVPFAGDMDLFTFRGTAGDVITVLASTRTGGVWPCVELIRPTGARLVTCAIRTTNQIDTTLTETGVHAILVRAYFATSIGSYTVGVQCLIGSCSGPQPPPPPSVPGAPLNLRAAVTGSTAVLNWTPPASGGAPASYLLEAGKAQGATDVAIIDTGSTATSITATAVPQGAYYVRVKARNAAGAGAPSNEVFLLVGAGPPPPCIGPPTAPTNLSVSVNGRFVTLQWVAPPEPVTTFVIDVGSAPGATNIASLSTGNARTTLSAIAAPGRYFIRVRARNDCGTSGASPEQSAVVF